MFRILFFCFDESFSGLYLSGYYELAQVALVVKNLPANAGDVRDTGSTHGSGRSSGGEHGNPLQYSCLENPPEQRSLVVKLFLKK